MFLFGYRAIPGPSLLCSLRIYFQTSPRLRLLSPSILPPSFLPSLSPSSLSALPAASLYSPRPNILYTEGFALDEFSAGKWGLRPFLPHQGSHKIGLILDAGMEEDMRLRHMQVADGARAALGVDVGGVVVTEEPMEVGLGVMPGGDHGGRWASREPC